VMPTAFFSASEVNLSQLAGYEVPSMVNGVSSGIVVSLCLNILFLYQKARALRNGFSANVI